MAIDLGGTKFICAAVDESGSILDKFKGKTDTTKGVDSLIESISLSAKKILKNHPEITKGVIASAGPLDPEEGLLLDPTNLTTNGRSWGIVPLIKALTDKLQIQLKLENDAAAAVMALPWSESTNCPNRIMITLGTGLGVGVVANGELVRAGRGLHPEIGHLIVGQGDKSASCACGNLGCAEAYLSGSHFAKRFSKAYSHKDLSGEEILDLAKNNNHDVMMAFEEYANIMADFLASMAAMFAPEEVYFGGGFSVASPFFLDQTKSKLEKNLKRKRIGKDLYPIIKIATNNEDCVLLGAAYLAFKEK